MLSYGIGNIVPCLQAPGRGHGRHAGAREVLADGPEPDGALRRGRLALGTWQGLYLNEHRNYGGPRSIIVTVQGQRR